MKFFVCEICGNMIEYVEESGVSVVCCGQQMTEMIPGTSDGAVEKHVPVVTIETVKDVKGAITNVVTVQVGAVEHPMVPEHYIQWIVLETTEGVHRIHLDPTDKPQAQFRLAEGEEVVAAYEYCNLHGLWEKK